MRRTIILSMAVFAFALGACSSSSNKSEQKKSTDSTTTQSSSTTQTFDLDTTKLKPGDVFYQCSMHQEVLSDRPGSCPKCSMDLSEMKKN